MMDGTKLVAVEQVDPFVLRRHYVWVAVQPESPFEVGDHAGTGDGRALKIDGKRVTIT
jgi:hypothetical protein